MNIYNDSRSVLRGRVSAWRCHDDFRNQKIENPHRRFACSHPSWFGGPLHHSTGIVIQNWSMRLLLQGFIGSLEPHFLGVRWVTMSCRGGFDDVEPHECPIPQNSISMSCFRVTTLHHRLGWLRLAIRQSGNQLLWSQSRTINKNQDVCLHVSFRKFAVAVVILRLIYKTGRWQEEGKIKWVSCEPSFEKTFTTSHHNDRKQQ